MKLDLAIILSIKYLAHINLTQNIEIILIYGEKKKFIYVSSVQSYYVLSYFSRTDTKFVDLFKGIDLIF